MYCWVYGYGCEPAEGEYPLCPVCGSACCSVYCREGEVVGCDACLEERDASDAEECFARAGRER